MDSTDDGLIGIVLIFLQGMNNTVDVYMMFANSALAGNTIIRSMFGAAFPLFGRCSTSVYFLVIWRARTQLTFASQDRICIRA